MQVERHQTYKKLYKKQWRLVIPWNKQHSKKQVVLIIYKSETNFFLAATFKGLRVLSLQTVKKNYMRLSLPVSFIVLEQKKRFNQTDIIYEK